MKKEGLKKERKKERKKISTEHKNEEKNEKGLNERKKTMINKKQAKWINQ